MQERGITESNEEFANYASEFFPIFYTNSFIIIEKPAAVKNRAFDNDIFFYNCVGDHTADRNPVSGMLCHGLRPS